MTYNLYNTDCYKLIPTLQDKSIDLVITDPPYQFDSKGGGFFQSGEASSRKYAGENAQQLSSESLLAYFLDLLEPKLKAFYGYFFCNKTLIKEYITWAEKKGYSYDLLVMAKSNPIPAHNSHHVSDLEYIILIREKGTYFCSKGLEIEDYKKFFLTSCKKKLHPAEKPIELIERFVRVSCPKDGIILDPFLGSGTTGLAAVYNGCNFIGVEQNEEYFALCQKRMKEWEDEQNGVGTLFEGML